MKGRRKPATILVKGQELMIRFTNQLKLAIFNVDMCSKQFTIDLSAMIIYLHTRFELFTITYALGKYTEFMEVFKHMSTD